MPPVLATKLLPNALGDVGAGYNPNILRPIGLTRPGGITSFFPFQERRLRVLQDTSAFVVAQLNGLYTPPNACCSGDLAKALTSTLPSGFTTIPLGTVC